MRVAAMLMALSAGAIGVATAPAAGAARGMGDEFTLLSTNTMQGQSFIASPVIVGGDIYLRSRTHLFRIGEG